MREIGFLSWLYDAKVDALGIRFVLFSFWTVHHLRFENIEAVTEIGNASWGAFNAYNFKSRFFARSFMITMRHGWFARKVLITPHGPDGFLAMLRRHNVKLILSGETSRGG